MRIVRSWKTSVLQSAIMTREHSISVRPTYELRKKIFPTKLLNEDINDDIDTQPGFPLTPKQTFLRR